MAENWSDIEIDLIVSDYFTMLANELPGDDYNKAAHNRALQDRIPRSRGSIEFKHQNISAVLLGLGQPWIHGYKPAANFQNALVDGVLRWLDANPDWLAPKCDRQGSTNSPLFENQSLWIGPPPALQNEPPPIDAEFISAIGKKYDVAQRDERNRALGKAGEQIVLRHERETLTQAGRSDLADQVKWTSVEEGDGFGFDIRSFQPNGNDRLLEVKTTNGWERTPFHISKNELNVADQHRDAWHLIRVWDFARKPKAFALRPPLEAHAELSATSFLATLR